MLRGVRRGAGRGSRRRRGRPLGLRRGVVHGRTRGRDPRPADACGAGTAPCRMTRLIIDTDTAGDDVFSLLIALRDRRAGLEALTICCGNVAFDQEVENALYTVEMAGRAGEVPVYAGCDRPLIAEWVGAEYVHGQDGMGDSLFPRSGQRPEVEHAVDELVRRVNESPGELTILAQAPL